MKKNFFKNFGIEKSLLIPPVLFGIMFFFFFNYKKEKQILSEYEISCQVTKWNSYSVDGRSAMAICDTLWIPDDLNAFYVSNDFLKRKKEQGREKNEYEIKDVPFPYELSKKRGSDTIVVVTEKQDTLLFYLPKFKPYENGIKTLFTDPKRYFREFFKIKEE